METTRETREKAQKKKWLFAAIAQVVIQSFRERSLWMRPSYQAGFDMADTLFDERQLYALAAAIFVKGTHAPRL